MGRFLDYLYQPTGAGILYIEVLIYFVAGVIALIAFGAAIRAYRVSRPKSPEVEAGYKNVECASCGWKGQVSKYVRACPKCNDSNFVSRF